MAGTAPTGAMRTPLARLSYPALLRPRSNRLRPNDPPQYGSTLIFNVPEIMNGPESDKKALAALLEAAQRLMKERFPKETWNGPFMDQTTGCHSPWLDGNLPKYRDKGGLGEGTRFIRTSSNRQIPCVGRNPKEVITDEGALYPGCYVYAMVAPFAYDPRKIRPEAVYGVGFGLRGIQFVKDGPRLDDSIDASEAFDALDGDTVEGDGMATLQALFGAAA